MKEKVSINREIAKFSTLNANTSKTITFNPEFVGWYTKVSPSM